MSTSISHCWQSNESCSTAILGKPVPSSKQPIGSFVELKCCLVMIYNQLMFIVFNWTNNIISNGLTSNTKLSLHPLDPLSLTLSFCRSIHWVSPTNLVVSRVAAVLNQGCQLFGPKLLQQSGNAALQPTTCGDHGLPTIWGSNSLHKSMRNMNFGKWLRPMIPYDIGKVMRYVETMVIHRHLLRARAAPHMAVGSPQITTWLSSYRTLNIPPKSKRILELLGHHLHSNFKCFFET